MRGARPVDVDAPALRERIGGVVPHDMHPSRQVHHDMRRVERASQSLRVVEAGYRARHHTRIRGSAAPGEADNRMAARDQPVSERGSDETGRTGYRDAHDA